MELVAVPGSASDGQAAQYVQVVWTRVMGVLCSLQSCNFQQTSCHVRYTFQRDQRGLR